MKDKNHVIDIPTDNKKEIYYVAKSFENKKSRIRVTQSFNNAVTTANLASNQKDHYNVYNSKGKIVHMGNRQKSKPVLNIHKGLKISVSGINAYNNPSDTIPDQAYHGIIEIQDNHLRNDKYYVKSDTEIPEFFWCKVRDIEKYLSNN